MNVKQCKISNYIPNESTLNVTYEKWCSVYFDDLIELYKILIRNFSEKFVVSDIKWSYHFKEFTRLVYKKSSKHLRKQF